MTYHNENVKPRLVKKKFMCTAQKSFSQSLHLFCMGQKSSVRENIGRRLESQTTTPRELSRTIDGEPLYTICEE